MQLLLMTAIAFSPVGQAMAAKVMDRMDMTSMLNDCVDCGQHLQMSQSGCVEADCFTDSCMNTSATSFFLYLDPASAVPLPDLSSMLEDRYRTRYLSQIPIPLYRPPIA